MQVILASGEKHFNNLLSKKGEEVRNKGYEKKLFRICNFVNSLLKIMSAFENIWLFLSYNLPTIFIVISNL